MATDDTTPPDRDPAAAKPDESPPDREGSSVVSQTPDRAEVPDRAELTARAEVPDQAEVPARPELWPSEPARQRWSRRAAWIGALSLFALAIAMVNSQLGLIGRPDEAQRARTLAGAAIAIAVLSVSIWHVLRAHDKVEGVRRLLFDWGVVLIAMWLLAVTTQLPVRPKGMLEAYAVVGVLMVIAAVGLQTKAPLVWAFGMVVASAFWICSATIALGLLFAETVDITRIAYLATAVLIVVMAAWALAALFRAGDEYFIRFDGSLSKLSGFTIAAVLGLVMTLYGVWYSLVVDPTDQRASINVLVSAEPVEGSDGQGRFGIVIRAENPTDSPILILHSPYEVQVGYRRGAMTAGSAGDGGPAAAGQGEAGAAGQGEAGAAGQGEAGAAGPSAPATDAARPDPGIDAAQPDKVIDGEPRDLEPTGTQAYGDPGDRSANVANSCVLNYRDNHPDTTLTQDEIITECSRAAFEQTLPPGILSPQPSADLTTLPEAFGHDCVDWRDRQPIPGRESWERREAYAALYPRLCELETGLAWQQPVRVPPRSFVETNIIVPTPARTDVIQVFTSFAYGYANRLQEDGSQRRQGQQGSAGDGGRSFTGACPANSQLYRVVAFDPITGLIGAWDPVIVEVSRGALVRAAESPGAQTATRPRSVICINRYGVTTSGADLSSLVGVHETLDQYFHDPS